MELGCGWTGAEARHAPAAQNGELAIGLSIGYGAGNETGDGAGNGTGARY